MSKTFSISGFEKGKQTITLISNILLLIGVILEFGNFKHGFLPGQYQMRLLGLSVMICSLLFLCINIRRYYVNCMLAQVYSMVMILPLDSILFPQFATVLHTTPVELFTRNMFFLMPHFGMVGFITSKKHTVIVGGLLLVIITCQVVSSNDEFFLASAPNFYMNVIGYAAALYFLVNFSEKFVGDIILSHKKLSIKGREITDSLNYAKRIQRSHLPSVLQIQKTLQDSFVLNKPKDIVSGDFYFFKEQGPKVFLAVADCTGHGVPGALLSILANEKLDASVRQSTDTSKILRLVNQKIKRALRQSDLENENYDGMDIALCSLDLDTQILCFAGANRPVWIIRSGANQVEEVKPTKASIAGHTRNEQNYQTHELQLNAGDSFYLFSDGFADTFGGKNGKKLMTKKFKSLLLDIQSKSMDEQGSYLDTYIDEWKRGLDQCDDILVIGVRV